MKRTTEADAPVTHELVFVYMYGAGRHRNNVSSSRPKVVLLVFYRGYW